MLKKTWQLLNHTYTLLLAVVVMTYILGAQSHRAFKHGDTNQQYKIVCSDASGYYAYLPQALIYHDADFRFLDEMRSKYPGSKFDEMLQPNESGKRVNKYFVGTAVCMAPAYFIAHVCTAISGGDTDGYSWLYLRSVCASALAFWLLGIVSIILLLRNYQVKNSYILFGIIALTFGTNLHFYTIYEPAFSHVYSFGLIAFLMLQTQRFALVPKSRYVIWMFVLLGLITILRPTNFLIVLLIPFFFGSLKNFFRQLMWLVREKWPVLLLSMALFLGLIFLQYLNVHYQHGYWGFNAYSIEKFDYLTNPKIPEVLFGFRKGFFVYTPFMLLLLPALFFLFRRSRYFFTGFMLFTGVFIYFMAAWWCWYYGGGLGMRPLVDIYALLVVPIVLMFSELKPIFRILVLIFAGFTIWFNLLLNYQFNNAILHYDAMNKERYWQIFMQTDDRFQWLFFFENPGFKPGNYKPLSRLEKVSAQLPTGGMLHFKYVPTAADSASAGRIAVDIRGSGQIEDPENIPKVMLLLYKDGKSASGGFNFFGPQLLKRGREYPLKIEVLATQGYAGYDSVEVIFENGKGASDYKNLSCTFYQFTPARR